jgi:hypothetical protein
MADRTMLQVPLSPSLKMRATQMAKERGFSSLQEFIRVFLTDFSSPKEEYIELSPAAKKRYARIDKDIEQGKNTKSYSSLEAFLKDLHAGI